MKKKDKKPKKHEITIKELMEITDVNWKELTYTDIKPLTISNK